MQMKEILFISRLQSLANTLHLRWLLIGTEDPNVSKARGIQVSLFIIIQ
jgi:hypothetical protein